MKDPKEYLDSWMNNSSEDPFKDLCNSVKRAQKDAYNQAIEDSVKSLQNYEMIWGNGAIVPSNQFEREILKLKIK